MALKTILLYVFLYATGVTVLTLSLERLPVFLQMEHAVYDPLQRALTIDHPSDRRYREYSRELADILAINLDTSFFYPETTRVRRDRLAGLLRALAEAPQLKAVFVDYLFPATDAPTPADSLLAESMAALGDRLVLPYEIEFAPVPIWGRLSAQAARVDDDLFVKPEHTGYLAFMTLLGDEVYRYHQLRLDDGSRQSAVLALIDADLAHPPDLNLRRLPDAFEINYVLRNEPPFQALTVYDAAAIMQGIPVEASGRIAFIGSFEHYRDIYGNPFDEFATPVSNTMPGVYLILNAYLNTVSGTYFRRANALIIFLLNALLATTGVFYFKWVQRLPVKPVGLMIAEITACLTLFVTGLFVLYYLFHLKVPFVLTLLALVRNQYFVRQWKKKIHNPIPA